MKKPQIIGIAISGGLAVTAFVLLQNFVSKPAPEQKRVEELETAKVLVAKTEIGLGQIVTNENFRWQEWPQSALSNSFIQSKGSGEGAMRELSGSVARAPMLPGEPITKAKLVKPGDGGVLSAILKPGNRAVSTKIREETSVGKMILPNDHVDVILIQRKRGRSGAEEIISDTLFRNVKVLAIGQLIEAKDNSKRGAEGNTATMELSPRQAELLALANTMGEITLTLRSIADIHSETEDGSNPLAQRGSSIRVLRYGVKSRAYGVN
jgi:pilus assembly protein CpaB